MQDNYQIAGIARLIADPGRAIMLMLLMDGRAYTAGELAASADLMPQTASSHLKLLEDSHLIKRIRQGRHHYFHLSGAEVADAIESLSRLSSIPTGKPIKCRTPTHLRLARTCYNHIAGELGVAIYDAFFARGFLLSRAGELALTEQGRHYFQQWDKQPEPSVATTADYAAKPCMDWSERRYHLAGPLAYRLLQIYTNHGLLKTVTRSRELSVTAKGWRHFADFDILRPVKTG